MNWPRLPLTTESKIVILSGAGISAESGIKTFRDQNGLWENHDVMEVATPQGFASNPSLVYQFYNQRRQQLLWPDVAPNPAHFALTTLQKKWRGEVIIITQNVDDLHERAGAKNVIHMHGELLKARCQKSGQIFECHQDITSDSICRCCQEKGNLRPDIVWFGEIPYFMNEIEKHTSESELFVAIGTSGLVYPAALLVSWARSAGAQTIEVNLEPTERSQIFHHSYQERAGSLIPKLVEELIRQASQPSF